MAGIYLHIPFCRQACNYCNFHFSTSMRGKNDFINALLKEMELRSQYICAPNALPGNIAHSGQTANVGPSDKDASRVFSGEELVETVYFGGGTPSLLEGAELMRIMERLRALFPVAADAEITLESNPDDISLARLAEWRRAGINRLSIGIQSFFEADLQWMNRAHDARQARECIAMAQGEGFGNSSIDLIYGGPTLSDEHWKHNVDTAIGLGIPHLSCYALTVEPRTALDTLIRRHRLADVNPDDQARQFLLLMDWTANAGYEHYEISNFAQPGRRSRHNSAYWQGKTYLGLGPSAHSFNGVSREWNVANNARYTAALSSGNIDQIIEKEDLTEMQKLNEYIMTSLRTLEGSDLGYIEKRFGKEASQELEKRAQRYIRAGKLIIAERMMLTKEGRLLTDGITADLFFVKGDLQSLFEC
ncbi:MAG TPA: radical SAM family heme chaperone HemW [Puia sp.]|nr:radical SAM family heme chaperone HemW [Puia sp.]